MHWAASFQNNGYHFLTAFAYHKKYVCLVLEILTIDASEIRNRIISINAQQKIGKNYDKKYGLERFIFDLRYLQSK